MVLKLEQKKNLKNYIVKDGGINTYPILKGKGEIKNDNIKTKTTVNKGAGI